MTSSATPHGSVGFDTLRAGLTFTTHDGDAAGTSSSRSMRATGLGLALCGGFCLLGFAALLWRVPADDTSAAPLAAPAVQAALPTTPVWVDVNHPFEAYDLAGGPYAKLPLRYGARRNADGSARQDTLTYGTPQPGEAFLRLLFYRKGDEAEIETTVFLDAARLAAGVGLAVVRSGMASSLTTRFGSFDVTGVAVSRGERSSDCLAFRRAGPQAVLQVTGLACGADAHLIDPAGLACTLDRIDLVSAGDDIPLRDVFVAAERRRGPGCQDGHGSGVRIGPGEADRAVRGSLKGSIAATDP